MDAQIWAMGVVLGLMQAPEKPRPQSLANLPVAAPEPAKPAAPKKEAPAKAAPPLPEAPKGEPARPAAPEAPAPVGESRGTFRDGPLNQGLRYRLTVRLRGEAGPLELHFRLVPTPARTTGNKVQKPRLGGWRLEAERGQGGQLIPAWILARAERLLYVSGPAPQLQPEPWSLTFGKQACPLWTVPVPPTLKASAYLVEILPKVLVLCDLHARFDRGDIAALDLQLEAFGWKPGIPPPENGTALLGSLQRWALQGSGSGETERVE